MTGAQASAQADGRLLAFVDSHPWHALAALLTFWLGAEALMPPIGWMDGAIYATIARNMAESGRWLEPRFTADSLPVFFEHPPTFFWVLGAFFEVFGISDSVAKLPNLLLAVGIAVGLFSIVRTWLGHRWALVAVWMWQCTPWSLKMLHSAILDVGLGFFVLWAYVALLRSHLWPNLSEAGIVRRLAPRRTATLPSLAWIFPMVMAVAWKGAPAAMVPAAAVFALAGSSAWRSLRSWKLWISILACGALLADVILLLEWASPYDVVALYSQKLGRESGASIDAMPVWVLLVKRWLSTGWPTSFFALVGLVAWRKSRDPLLTGAVALILGLWVVYAAGRKGFAFYYFPVFPANAIIGMYGVRAIVRQWPGVARAMRLMAAAVPVLFFLIVWLTPLRIVNGNGQTYRDARAAAESVGLMDAHSFWVSADGASWSDFAQAAWYWRLSLRPIQLAAAEKSKPGAFYLTNDPRIERQLLGMGLLACFQTEDVRVLRATDGWTCADPSQHRAQNDKITPGTHIQRVSTP